MKFFVINCHLWLYCPNSIKLNLMLIQFLDKSIPCNFTEFVKPSLTIYGVKELVQHSFNHSLLDVKVLIWLISTLISKSSFDYLNDQHEWSVVKQGTWHLMPHEIYNYWKQADVFWSLACFCNKICNTKPQPTTKLIREFK